MERPVVLPSIRLEGVDSVFGAGIPTADEEDLRRGEDDQPLGEEVLLVRPAASVPQRVLEGLAQRRLAGDIPDAANGAHGLRRVASPGAGQPLSGVVPTCCDDRGCGEAVDLVHARNLRGLVGRIILDGA